MKHYKLCLTILLGVFISIGMLTESRAQTYTGDLTLATQAEVVAFNYTEVTGNLTIISGDITDLTPLSTLASVGGYLNVSYNVALTNLDGLGALTSVGGFLYVGFNEVLTNLDGLNALTSVGEYFVVISNVALTNLDGLSALTSVAGFLNVIGNTTLTNLDGLGALTSVGGNLLVNGNATLTNLDGLSALTSVGGYLYVLVNASLTNLDGLSALTSVGGDLQITDNTALTGFCGLYALISGGFTGDYTVTGNAANPTQADILNGGACNQPPVVEIHEIQGAGLVSPYDGQTVTTENNIVTGVAVDGFSMQAPDARVDADTETSEGIFVFTGSAPSVSVGDAVDVTGDVNEFFEFTQLNNPLVTVISPGNSLPTVVIFDATTPSPAAPQSPNEFERFEGMLIQITGGMITGPNQRFNPDPFAEVFITANSNRTFREPGIEYPGLSGLPVWDGNPEVFELDPDRLGLPNQIIPGGSSFDATGVLGYEFGGYELFPTSLALTPATLPVPVRDRDPGEVTVGTLNLFRLFDDVNDGGEPVVSTADYNSRLTKFSMYIRNVLNSPEILAVQETEKLGVLQDLAAKILADDPSVTYTAYLIEGNDIGGIDIGFMVRSNVVVNSVTQLGASELFTYDNSLLHERPPLVIDTELPGGTIIKVLNIHPRSMSSIDSDPVVRQKRDEQATSISMMVQNLQTSNPYLIVTGDFNAFQFTDGYVDVLGQISGTPSDVTQALIPGTDQVNPDLTNQILSLPANQQYSYIFLGNSRVVDHMLTSQTLNSKVSGIAFGRGNADAAWDLINDNSTVLRASDHDGFVLYLTPDVTPPVITVADPLSLWPPNHKYETIDIAQCIISVEDDVDGSIPVGDVVIEIVSSDEPDNASGNEDGNTINDMVIDSDCKSVDLRRERQENGNGRVYTIHVSVSDAAGNVAIATCLVTVPHDKNVTAIDDGPVNTVISDCAESLAKFTGNSSVQENNLLSTVPENFALEQNYPNPFNPSTVIRYALPENAKVSLVVYDILGSQVAELVNGNIAAGIYEVAFDATNLTSGIYFYRLTAGSFTQINKMILLK